MVVTVVIVTVVIVTVVIVTVVIVIVTSDSLEVEVVAGGGQ